MREVLWSPGRRLATVAIVLISGLAGAAGMLFILGAEPPFLRAGSRQDPVSAPPNAPAATVGTPAANPMDAGSVSEAADAVVASAPVDAGSASASADAVVASAPVDAGSASASADAGLASASADAGLASASADAGASTSADAALASRTVRVRISSGPRGARVYRLDDGKLLGNTPLVVDFPFGDERIGFRLRKKGYRGKTRWITPNKDQRTRAVLRRR